MGRIFWKMDRSMLLYGCFLILLFFELTEIVTAQRLYDVRLVGGSNPMEGRVEIYYQSSWGTVCDDLWGAVESDVVCRQLGYFGNVETHARAAFGEGTGRIWLDDVSCTGIERSLSLCSHHSWGSNDCSHSEDVGVRCNVGSGSSEGLIRLSGIAENEGRVEVYHNGQWGTVCDDNWDTTDGDVACRQLGFPGVDAVINVDSGLGPIWLDNLECGGMEISLSACPHNGWGINDCSHAEDAGVQCLPIVEPELPDGSVRLADGTTKSEGRVEIFHNGEWGTVCDDSWDRVDGAVVCRQLGYAGVDLVYDSAHFGRGSGSIFLDDVECSGSEQALAECSSGGWGIHNCGHGEDAGVSCMIHNLQDGSVRLADGTTESEGRVEIFYNGEWGTICDDSWDRSDGSVVCRQLGYARVDLVYDSAHFGRGSGSILLDDVECSGSEQTLAECSSGGWGIHNCGHGEDAGVRCTFHAEEGTVRLVNGPSEMEGVLEIYHDNRWGTVCSNSFGIEESKVVCRQLGYSGKATYFTALEKGYSEASGQIWLDSLECSGDEEQLHYCTHAGWEKHDCTNLEDVGVSCSNTGGSLSGGAIAGIVIGSLVGICLFYCCCLRSKKKSQPPTVYNAVRVDQSRTEEQQELGAVTGAVDANNTPHPPVIPVEPYDASVPDLPPPSYDEIGNYSSAGMPGAEMAYPPAAAAPPYPTAASSTPHPPAAPSEVPYPPPSTNASVTYNYPSADSGVVPSAPPAYTPS